MFVVSMVARKKTNYHHNIHVRVFLCLPLDFLFLNYFFYKTLKYPVHVHSWEFRLSKTGKGTDTEANFTYFELFFSYILMKCCFEYLNGKKYFKSSPANSRYKNVYKS